MERSEILKKTVSFQIQVSQNKKNECTLCHTIGVSINGFYIVNQEENKGKME